MKNRDFVFPIGTVLWRAQSGDEKEFQGQAEEVKLIGNRDQICDASIYVVIMGPDSIIKPVHGYSNVFELLISAEQKIDPILFESASGTRGVVSLQISFEISMDDLQLRNVWSKMRLELLQVR